MDISSFPLVLLLLLPGFLAIHVFFVVTRFRNLSTFHGTTWSLIVSLILVIALYPIYTYLTEPPPNKPWPGLLEAMGNPALVPGPVWLLLYASAIPVGVLLGLVDRTGLVETPLRSLGIDLSRHRDVWGRLFREPGYLLVYLKDGNVLYGWPEYYSSDRSQPGPELYLTQMSIWNGEQSEWADMGHVGGVLIDAESVSRIEFLVPPHENGIPEVQP